MYFPAASVSFNTAGGPLNFSFLFLGLHHERSTISDSPTKTEYEGAPPFRVSFLKGWAILLLGLSRSCALIGLLVLLASFCLANGKSKPPQNHPARSGHVRVYFIAAEEVDWDYAPSGRDEAMGGAFEDFEKNYVRAGTHRIGRVYKKAVYREYFDAKFNRLVERPAEQQYLGLLGPVLYAEVGDTIKVVFKNKASRVGGA